MLKLSNEEQASMAVERLYQPDGPLIISFKPSMSSARERALSLAQDQLTSDLEVVVESDAPSKIAAQLGAANEEAIPVAEGETRGRLLKVYASEESNKVAVYLTEPSSEF